MRLGFPRLLLDLHQSGILQFPQGVDRFLPPTAEQLHYLIDGIVEVNPPIFICPAIFPGQVCPAQDKGIQHLCFVGQWRECGGFKKEIGKPGKANRFFRLMDIKWWLSYRVLWTVRSPFPGADGSFYCLPLFCACKACNQGLFSP